MNFWAVTHRHTTYVEAETEAEALENCADQVRDNAAADDCEAEEISEEAYERHWALIENGIYGKHSRPNCDATKPEKGWNMQAVCIGTGRHLRS